MATRLGSLAVWAGLSAVWRERLLLSVMIAGTRRRVFPPVWGAGGSVFAFRVVGVPALIGCCCKEGSARMLMFIAVLRELLHTRTG